MPVVHIHMFEGRTVEQKSAIVKGVTEVLIGRRPAVPDSKRPQSSSTTRQAVELGRRPACWRQKRRNSDPHRDPSDPPPPKFVGGIYVIIDPDHCGGRDIFARLPRPPHPPERSRRPTPPQERRLKSIVTAEAKLVQSPGYLPRKRHRSSSSTTHPDIAAEVGADGVHVGQGDLSIAECRAIMGPDQIVGKSNALFDEAITSFNEGADYIAVGSIYTTTTKSDTRPAGLSTLRAVADRVTAPIVAIGGINASSIAAVAQAGADCACVATAVTMAQNPAAATRELVERFGDARAVT